MEKNQKEEKALNLYQKLSIIGEAVKVLKKTKRGYGYNYVPDEEILARIQGGMEKYNISLIPNVDISTVEVIPRDTLKTKVKDGQVYEERSNEVIIRGGIRYDWVNNDDPSEKISVPWFFIGQQGDASQAFGSALTYAARYFKIQYFNVATTDDPDQIIKKKKEAEAAEARKALDDIIAKIAKTANDRIAAHPEDKDKIIGICKQYVIVDGKPSANYKKLVDPVAGAQLLEALNKFAQGGK